MISFCSVNAHFQNGVTEKRIRDLQEAARTQLLHAKHRWPSAVHTCLWPYAIRYANDVHNSTTRVDRSESTIELFLSTNIRPKLRHYHPFACPAVYVLKNKLQAGQPLPKWESRSLESVLISAPLQGMRAPCVKKMRTDRRSLSNFEFGLFASRSNDTVGGI